MQTSFASGELDPSLRGQHTLKAYQEGAKRIRNGVRRSTGGIGRRNGFDDLAGMNEARLESFEFSDEQRYVLAFGEQRLDIFDLNGVLLQTIAGCPWTLAAVDALTFSQTGDVMVITNCVPTKILTRTGASSFALATFSFDQSPNGNLVYQPYFKFARPEVTMTPSAATGAITLTASSTDGWGGFTASHVGQRIRIYDAEVEITSITSALVANGTVKGTLVGRLDIDPFKTEKDSTVVEVTHVFHGLTTGGSVTFSGSGDVGFIPSNEFNTTHTITVVDEHHYSINLAPLSYTVREDADFDGVNENTTWTAARDSDDAGGPNVKFNVAGTPTRAWLEPSINALRGYPAASCFHEGRLWLGGTPSQPDARWGSKTLYPYNFDIGTGLDGDSVQVAGDTEDLSRIRHMVSNGDLQVFTPLRESIFLQSSGLSITPSTARTKTQSNAGVGDVQPVIFDGATLFVQENGLSVSELSYSERVAAYLAVPISTLAGHLVRNPRAVAVSLGTDSKAEQFAFFCNSDGTIAVFHSLRTENIAGWGLWELGGGVLARGICTAGQNIFVCAQYPDGSHRLWRQAEGGIYCLDGQVRHVTSVATASWVLAPRCRGRSMGIVTELGYHGVYDVPADGEIQLDTEVTEVVAGDPFNLEIVLLPPAVATPAGSRMGMKQRVVQVILDLINAYALTVDGRHLPTHPGADISGPLVPLNGHVARRVLGFSRAPEIIIGQAYPLPVEAVVSVLMEVKV